ncbi:MAG: hypothetical protein IIA65_07095 [Planctomycetes bacterium]|nr:hypothetical protein [Planctomycetota bacterium]
MHLWSWSGDARACHVRTIPVLLLTLLAVALPVTAQIPLALWPSDGPQEGPRIQGHRVVWHQFMAEFGDYDVVVADVNRLDEIQVQVLSLPGDQMHPDAWGRRVVWQEYVLKDEFGDWDINGADLGDWTNPRFFAVSGVIDNDEQFPAISGNTVLWQDGPEDHYDIFASDITDPNWPLEFVVAAFEGSQERPAVDRTRAVWQDNFHGDWDVYASDIWLRDQPMEFIVTPFADQQTAPALSGNRVVWQDDLAGDWDLFVSILSEDGVVEHLPIAATEGNQVNARIEGPLVVWQDDRFGHWDIFLYNLNTGQEFRLTEDPADQTLPDIDGDLVVWQDNRLGSWDVFVLRLASSMLAE